MKRFLMVSAAAAMSVCMLAACGNSGTTGETANNTNNEAQTEAASEAAEGGETEETDASAEIDLSTVDFDDVAATIEFGDFSGIETLTDDILAGNYDGKVIVIDGVNFKAVTHASIMEVGEDGVKKGITYQLDGVENIDDYPADDAHIKITGVVGVDDEWGARYVLVPQDKLEVIE